MTSRDALGLDDAELTQFLDDEVGRGAKIVVASPGEDGYPDVGLVAARYIAAQDTDTAVIEIADSSPHDGVPVCAIVERGATYDDICAAIIRGVVSNRRVAVDDVVTFAFAKLHQ